MPTERNGPSELWVRCEGAATELLGSPWTMSPFLRDVVGSCKKQNSKHTESLSMYVHYLNHFLTLSLSFPAFVVKLQQSDIMAFGVDTMLSYHPARQSPLGSIRRASTPSQLSPWHCSMSLNLSRYFWAPVRLEAIAIP